MPFKKKGKDDYVSPSGRHFNTAQVRLYHAHNGFPKPNKASHRDYAKGGIIRPPLEDPDIDERPAQARRDIEGAMKSLGTVEDPDFSGGRGIREHENWPYTEEGEEDPTPGRRS